MGLETIAMIATIGSGLASVGSAISGMMGGGKKSTEATTTQASGTAETPEQAATKKNKAIAAMQQETAKAQSSQNALGTGEPSVTQKTLLGL